MIDTTPLGIRVAQRAVTGAAEPWGDEDPDSLPQAELIGVVRDMAEARRRLDAEFAAASASIARRSKPEDGAAGLARRHGFKNPTQMIASVTGGSTGEAGRLIAVGTTTGEMSPPLMDDASAATPPAPRFPVLAAAVKAGKISIDSAGAVGAMLERVAPKVEAEVLARAEAHLVERAQHLPFNKLGAVIRQCEARFDIEEYAKDEEVRRGARYLNIFESQQTGMVIVDGRLDVESAAPLRAALDAMVGDYLRRKDDAKKKSGAHEDGVAGSDGEAGGPYAAFMDDRTISQVRADALADMARHCLSCDTDHLPLNGTTVMVRVGLKELRSGLGLGEIDGCDQPVTATTIRRMAADAEIIPFVMGADGEVLDCGRARRLFSKSQKLVLTERDGGCAHCHAPPGYSQGHHIKWWERDGGRTDLKNGVMLCSTCHHRLHRDGWGIEIRDGVVWFIPPAFVDRQRRPVKGGRAKFEYTDRDHQQVTRRTLAHAS